MNTKKHPGFRILLRFALFALFMEQGSAARIVRSGIWWWLVVLGGNWGLEKDSYKRAYGSVDAVCKAMNLTKTWKGATKIRLYQKGTAGSYIYEFEFVRPKEDKTAEKLTPNVRFRVPAGSW